MIIYTRILLTGNICSALALAKKIYIKRKCFLKLKAHKIVGKYSKKMKEKSIEKIVSRFSDS